MNITFLPKDYQAPKSTGGYMKLQEGENRIRILSQPIFGWEDWNSEKKPVRFPMNEKPKPFDSKKPVRHFWSFIVWNYSEEQIQILHLTQATIRNNIEALCNDENWGAPFFYDIKIIKKGEGTDTEYMVNPLPHKPVADHIVLAFHEKRIWLPALFHNMDPFAPYTDYTHGIFTHIDTIEQNVDPFVDKYTISQKQADELKKHLALCSQSYQDWVLEALSKPPTKINQIEDLPIDLYDRLLQAAIKNKAPEVVETFDWIKEA